jgi:hypothetical protein
MPRSFLDDWAAGQVLTWSVGRGKCRYGPSHESVRDVGGEWWGESSRDNACPYAPMDQCSPCAGQGRIKLTAAEQAAAQYDGPAEHAGYRICPACRGVGLVPGPHWPWRWPKPPPLRPEAS